jgi:rubrerythrin
MTTFDHWECPVCGYIKSDIEVQDSRLDFGCPRCNTPSEDFGFYLASAEDDK